MSRPEFPHCVMTGEMINMIRSAQEHYDRDPERAEYEQEQYYREQQLEAEYRRQEGDHNAYM